MIQVLPIMLCGGSGTRLWPLSRKALPKQFISLIGEESLLQQAAIRLNNLDNDAMVVAPPIVVASDDHRFLASHQLSEVNIKLGQLILEPVGRDTAPALTLAALAALDSGVDPVLVVTPTDQMIANPAAFKLGIQQAVEIASMGTIVIFGVTPDRPETGYGYIKVKQGFDSMYSVGGHPLPVESFVEKPDASAAESFLIKGGYFWNAGLFVLKASVWLNALQKFRPDILQATRTAWEEKEVDGIFVRPGYDSFSSVPVESIDYAVMVNAPNSIVPIEMIKLDAGWSDLGNWNALWDILPKDVNANAHVGDAFFTDSTNTLVHANSRLVSLLGVHNLIVIETPDAILVADRKCSQEVKRSLNVLANHGREEQSLHRKVSRPWGWFDIIDEGERFKVKRIQVRPGASLSLQKHEHRAEHWIVVKGTAEVTKGDKITFLTENESTYIPKDIVHRLANPGKTPLEIIEVQSGSYLGEDDIVRFEDNYGRSK